MPELSDLTPASVPDPEIELHEAVVLDDAYAVDDKVRAARPSLDLLLAEDPMQWTPYTLEGVGTWYPKKGDRAIIGFPEEGEPVITQWWPSTPAPDLKRPTFCEQRDLDLFGPESRTSEALSGDASVHVYTFPGSALTASTRALLPDITGTVVKAIWDVAWNVRGSRETGIELVGFKAGPTDITQAAEITGATVQDIEKKSLVNPVHSSAIVTAEVGALLEEAKETGTARFLGHRMKTGPFPAEASVVFMSRVTLALQY